MSGLLLRGLRLLPIILSMTSEALACPVCGVGRNGTGSVYLMTAVVMSVVPLVICGAMAYFLYRRTQQVSSIPFYEPTGRKLVQDADQ